MLPFFWTFFFLLLGAFFWDFFASPAGFESIFDDDAISWLKNPNEYSNMQNRKMKDTASAVLDLRLCSPEETLDGPVEVVDFILFMFTLRLGPAIWFESYAL